MFVMQCKPHENAKHYAILNRLVRDVMTSDPAQEIDQFDTVLLALTAKITEHHRRNTPIIF
jgi:hypothetical protein